MGATAVLSGVLFPKLRTYRPKGVKAWIIITLGNLADTSTSL